MSRDKYLKRALGVLHDRIKESRVLLVGAGGIGCELLKNLVLTGFGEVHIVDLDTIDLSNLNRQFLFRQEHIKRPKALVAKESATKYNPNVTIEAKHAKIIDPQFCIDWYKSFHLVFNALDNLEARRHVNKMCLAADVPLIESGTTGFLGQVQVIKRGRSQCYDCTPKETPKTFPVCTIRSTPSQPIHCIVWAKSYLFAEIFGTSEEDSPELDTTADSENAAEIAKLRDEARALKMIRESMGSEKFPRKVFEKVFKEDIERLRSMEDMWKTRKMPEALDFDRLQEEASGVEVNVAEKDQSAWTVAENFVVFSSSLKLLSDRLDEIRASTTNGNAPPVLSFDKDDKDALDFVTSTANLRSAVFGIETKSEFDVKQMAGNIIPAITTTNAKVAGLCVMQAFKVMRGDYDKARHISLFPSHDRVFAANSLLPPNPECAVCGVAQSRIEVDLSRATLEDLTDGLLKARLGYKGDFSVSSDSGLLYDPDFDDNLKKPLRELDIKGDSFLTIADEDDEEPRVNLVLSVVEKSLPQDSQPIELTEKIEIAMKIKPARETPEKDEHVEITTNGSGSKRKRSIEEEGLEVELVTKRGKVFEENNHEEMAVDETHVETSEEKSMGKKIMEERSSDTIAEDGDGVVSQPATTNGTILIEDD